MPDESIPRRGELYRDSGTRDLFEVVGVAREANSGRRLVVYVHRGGRSSEWVALDLERWREAVAAKVLSLVAGAKP